MEDLIPRYTCNGSTASPGSPQVMLVAPPLVPTLVQLAPNQSRFYCFAHQYFWSAQYHCSSSQLLLLTSSAHQYFCFAHQYFCSAQYYCNPQLLLLTSSAHQYFCLPLLLLTTSCYNATQYLLLFRGVLLENTYPHSSQQGFVTLWCSLATLEKCIDCGF